MSFEITGKLIAKFDVQQKSETFKTREFVIEKTDDVQGRMISNYIKFQSVQERTNLVDKYNLGDDIKVSFNIRGTKWAKDGKESYFTNLDAWRIETIKMGQDVAPQNDGNILTDNFIANDTVTDDLPF